MYLLGEVCQVGGLSGKTAMKNRAQGSLSTGSSEDGDLLDLADDEGWQDLEPDVELMKVCCLLCDVVFQDVKSMTTHCKASHGMDLVQVQKDLGA